MNGGKLISNYDESRAISSPITDRIGMFHVEHREALCSLAVLCSTWNIQEDF